MSVVLYSVGRHRRAGCQFIWNVSKSRVHSNRQGRKEEGGYNLEHLLVSRVCMVWKWDFCIATRFESSPELQLFYKWQLFIDTVERLKLFSITAEPLLSGHPQGKGKWPLKEVGCLIELVRNYRELLSYIIVKRCEKGSRNLMRTTTISCLEGFFSRHFYFRLFFDKR